MANENSFQKAASADFDAVVAQMAALRADVAHLSQRVQSKVGAKGAALSQEITDYVDRATSYISRKGHAADARIEGAIAGNPYLALGLAVGMGVLLGALARR